MVGDREHDVLGAREQGIESRRRCFLVMVTGQKWKNVTLLI